MRHLLICKRLVFPQYEAAFVTVNTICLLTLRQPEPSPANRRLTHAGASCDLGNRQLTLREAGVDLANLLRFQMAVCTANWRHSTL